MDVVEGNVSFTVVPAVPEGHSDIDEAHCWRVVSVVDRHSNCSTTVYQKPIKFDYAVANMTVL